MIIIRDSVVVFSLLVKGMTQKVRDNGAIQRLPDGRILIPYEDDSLIRWYMGYSEGTSFAEDSLPYVDAGAIVLNVDGSIEQWVSSADAGELGRMVVPARGVAVFGAPTTDVEDEAYRSRYVPGAEDRAFRDEAGFFGYDGTMRSTYCFDGAWQAIGAIGGAS